MHNSTRRTTIWIWIAVLSPLVYRLHAQSDIQFDGCEVEDYYADLLSPGTTNLRDGVTRQDLESLLEETHRKILPYTDDDRDDVWKALIELDSGNEEDTVRLLYRQVNVPSRPFGTSDTWNREHLWPKSWGVGYTGPDFTDIHHLRPTDWNVNSARNNLYFGECGTVEPLQECKRPAHSEAANDTAIDPTIFLPPEITRGEIARAILYMDIRYSDQNNDGLDLTVTDCPSDLPHEMAYKSALLHWHQSNPVTDKERQRNQRACERWQGNRNPFVDFPGLAEKFFGSPQSPLGEGLGYPCVDNPVTSSPPTTMRSCKDLHAGDVMPIAISSDSDDLVAFVALKHLDGGLVLFLTDNAWMGSSFRTNEGTISLQLPSTGISAGAVFGYGGTSDLLHNGDWEKVQGQFQLSANGDTVLLYCEDNDDIHFLSGIDYNDDGWMEPNATPDVYGSQRSALPSQLSDKGAISLPHFDNYRYNGLTSGVSISQLQSLLSDPFQWKGSDDVISSPLPQSFSLPLSSSPSELAPGDVMIVGMNSGDPDMVALVALKSLPGNIPIYLTDNAWTGDTFRSNEGTLKLTLGETGLTVGTVFGYGLDLLHGNDWESAGGRFALAEAGDTIIVYTIDDNDQIQHLSAFSYTGGWKEAGISDSEYGTDSSALPASLVAVGGISLPHKDNYGYIGPIQGTKGDLQLALQDEMNWMGSNSDSVSPPSDPFLVISSARRPFPLWPVWLVLATPLIFSI